MRERNHSSSASKLGLFASGRFLRLLLFLLALIRLDPLLNPLEYIPLVVQQHLAEPPLWRLDQGAVPLRRLPSPFVGTPDCVSLRDKYEGMLAGISGCED